MKPVLLRTLLFSYCSFLDTTQNTAIDLSLLRRSLWPGGENPELKFVNGSWECITFQLAQSDLLRYMSSSKRIIRIDHFPVWARPKWLITSDIFHLLKGSFCLACYDLNLCHIFSSHLMLWLPPVIWICWFFLSILLSILISNFGVNIYLWYNHCLVFWYSR